MQVTIWGLGAAGIAPSPRPPPPDPLPQGEGECQVARMRMRADQLLVDRGLAESRSRAQALILAGKVFSGERRIAKAGDTARRGGRPGGARPGPSVGVARRAEARSCAAPLRPVAGRAGLSRHRRLHRRLHRRAAGARCGEGACGRCRPRPARLEAAHRSARRGAREDQRPLPDARADRRSDRRPGVRRELHRPRRPCCRRRSRSARRAPGPWR